MPRRKHVSIKLDGIAGKLGAQVYSESPGFICLLEEDIHESVVGRGASVVEAVNNWDEKLKAHLRNAGQDDVIVALVKSHLAKPIETIIPPKSTSVRISWADDNKPAHVIEWESQFYTSKSRKK